MVENVCNLSMKILISLLTVILSFTFVQAQVVTGVIRDAGTRDNLSFATIEIRDLDLGVESDMDGAFSMQLPAPGEYKVRASYVGFNPAIETVSVGQHDTVHIEFEMRSTISMDEVVVTGTMKQVHVSKSPVKVDVYDAKQLETFLPAASSNLVDNMKMVSGVQEVVACGVCYTNSISINGLEGTYTAVLMDGTPMYGNLASVYGLNGIPNLIIDRFEVIKGPSSTLYGSEAVAGIINIITKDPSEQPVLAVDLMGTSHMESFGNISSKIQLGKTTGMLGLNYAYINDFDDVNHDSFGDGINLDRYSLFSKWNFGRKSGKPFTLAAKYYYEDRRNGVEEFVRDRAYRKLRGSDSIYGESIYTHRFEVFGSYVFNSEEDLKLDYSFSTHDQDSYYGSDFYKAGQNIAYASLQWRKPIGSHDLLLGATLRYNNYDDNTVATETLWEGDLVNDPVKQFIPGVFVQDEWSVGEDLTFLGGMRLDHYGDHGFVSAPRLNVKYDFSDWTSVRANFGTGFRIVNLFTEDHAFVTGQRKVEIIEDLKPEQSVNYSMNVHHVYALFDGSGSFDVDAYYTHFKNKIFPDYSDPAKIIYSNSSGYAVSKGISFSGNYSFYFPLAFSVNGNIQQVVEYEKDPTTDEENKRYVEYAPKWTGAATANYTFRKSKITLGYTGQITGPMRLPEVFDLNNEGLPLATPRPLWSNPFALHNIQVTKQFNKAWSVYLGIQNLANYIQRSSPLVGYNDPNAAIGFSPFFDTSYAYAPNHGREFYIGFKWSVE